MEEDNIGPHQRPTGGKREREPSPTGQSPTHKRTCLSSDTGALSASHGSNAKIIGGYLPTAGVDGEQFRRYMKEIWSFLMNDDVSTIGIYGIGGVGKTEVAKRIYNKLLLLKPDKFHHVLWIELSPGSGIHDLQTFISNEARLGLAEKKKSVLFLDGVWDYVPLNQDVGIPLGADGCIVVVITRSLGACIRLGCQRKIEMRCLPPDESRELFKKKLGNKTVLSEEVEEISRSVADRCVGLPLAITIMTNYMRGVTDISKWGDALRGDTQKKVDMEIFQRLKFSYDHYLKDTASRNCFLYCPLLFREHKERPFLYSVSKKKLAEKLVKEGLIKGTNTRKEELDKARRMVDFLRDVGLLEIPVPHNVEMNPLIRNMALQIMEENDQRAMIKNDASLKDMPDKESWTGDLVRVSLQGNQIESIPSTFSPRCSNLLTLLLSENLNLRDISGSFFSGMPRLKVLDLSCTSIERLPSSISDLVNLTALILSCCAKLRELPSLGKLLALEKLDVSLSAVGGVAEGIEKLLNLKYLDLHLTEVNLSPAALEHLPPRLQFLRLPSTYAVKGDNVAQLSSLENLQCCFCDVVELNTYLTRLKEMGSPRRLHVEVGTGPWYRCGFKSDKVFDVVDRVAYLAAGEDRDRSVVAFNNCNRINEVDMLFYFNGITIAECNETTSLCSPIKGATELKHFSIKNCETLEFLCSLRSFPGGQGLFEKVYLKRSSAWSYTI